MAHVANSATIEAAETDPMRSIARFFKDAGYHGGGSVILAVILFGITIWEHAHNKAVGAWWLWALVVLTFGYGAVVAWHKEYKAGLAKDAQIAALASKSCDWKTEWLQYADRFKGPPTSRPSFPVTVKWQKHDLISPDGQWDLGFIESSRYLESLCRLAGEFLSASPSASLQLAPEVTSTTDAVVRWLSFLKSRGEMQLESPAGLHETVNGQMYRICFGSIRNLAEASERACIDCAAMEVRTKYRGLIK